MKIKKVRGHKLDTNHVIIGMVTDLGETMLKTPVKVIERVGENMQSYLKEYITQSYRVGEDQKFVSLNSSDKFIVIELY